MKVASKQTTRSGTALHVPRMVAARLAAAAAGCALITAPVHAEPVQGTPEHMRAGNFYISPEVLATTAFDSNLFRTATGQKSDIRIEIVPVINVTSNLPRHEINFLVAGKLVSLVENDDQNYEDIRGQFSGALHIDHAHTLDLDVLSELKHEEKGLTLSPSDAKRPVPIFHNHAAAGLTRDAGRLYGSVAISADRWDYHDVEDQNNQTLDQDYRDTDLFTAQFRAGYRFSPGFEFVGQLKALRQLSLGDELNSSQSTGYEATAGIKFETSPLLHWQLLGGWGVRDFDHEDMATIQSSILAGEVEWSPTERMTVKGTVSRAIAADTAEAGIGSIQTSISGGLDYEIYHNLVAHAGAGLSQTEFATSDRKDTLYSANLGLDYYFSKNAAFTLGYQHEVRDSTLETSEMTRDVVTIGAKLKF